MVQEKILHDCVKQLLSSHNKVSGYNAVQDQSDIKVSAEYGEAEQRAWRYATKECLCQFLTLVGSYMDKSEKAKSLMDQYFKRIKQLLDLTIEAKTDTNNKFYLPSRIRFMMEDLLDLRKINWIPQKAGQRINVDEPKLLSQIRQEHIAPESEGRLFANQFNDMKKHEKFSKNNDNKQTNNVETKMFGVLGINKGSLARSDEFHLNGTNHDNNNKYNLKNNSKNANSADEDMDWRNNKIDGSWRTKINSGTATNKTKKPTTGKVTVDEVWRKDGQQGSNNSNQIMNLPPRMMRRLLETQEKSGQNESVNEESAQSTSSSSNSYTELSKTTGNINEIFALKKPKTLFEPDYLKENSNHDVYLGPVDKFQRPLIQSNNNSLNKSTAVKPNINSIKTTDNAKTNVLKMEKHINPSINKLELAEKIMCWLNSREEINEISLATVEAMLISLLNNNSSYHNNRMENSFVPKLDEELISKIIINCCSSSNSKSIDRFCEWIEKLKQANITPIDTIKSAVKLILLLDEQEFAELISRNRSFETNLVMLLANLVISDERLLDLTSLLRLLNDRSRYMTFVMVLKQISQFDRGLTAQLVKESGLSVYSTIPETMKTNDQIIELFLDPSLSYLAPEYKFRHILNSLPDNFDLFSSLFVQNDSVNILNWILENVGSEKEALEFTVMWLIENVLVRLFQTNDSTKSTKDLIETEKSTWKNLSPVIEYYLSMENSERDQLTILYSLQQFWNNNKQPKGALLRCFICFYDLELIDEDIYYKWKDDIKGKIPEKGKALFEVNKWLQFLKNADYIKPVND